MRRLFTIFLVALLGGVLTVATQTPAMAVGGTLTGIVTDEVTGDPIPGVVVDVFTTQYMPVAHTYTDQDGRFTTPAVPAGTYKIRYNPPMQTDYPLEWYDGQRDFNSANTVTVGGTPVTADAQLGKGFRLFGSVTADGSGDPLQGAGVQVYLPGGSSSVASGYTDQSGNFTTGVLAPGTYKIRYDAPQQSDYLGEWHSNKSGQSSADIIEVVDDNLRVDASLVEGFRLTTTVTAEQTGAPAPQVRVYVHTDEYSTVANGQTDQNGVFTTQALPPGDYRVNFEAPFGTDLLGEWYKDRDSYGRADPIELTTQDVSIDAALATGMHVTGRVTAEDTGDALAGVYVFVDAADGTDSMVAMALTEPDGSFSAGPLKPGDYKVRYWAPYSSPYISEWHDNASTFDDADRLAVTTQDVTADAALTLGTRVVGTVTDSRGAPVPWAGVQVQFDGQGPSDYAYADENGQYASRGMPPGDYKVQFRGNDPDLVDEWFENKADYDSADPVTLAEARDTTIDAELGDASHIVGQVTDPQGDPVRAKVHAYGPGGTFTDNTARDGSYDIGGLGEGSYSLQITPTEPSALISEWWQDERDADDADAIQIGSVQTVTADVTLDVGAEITGTVVDQADQPVEGVTVRATGAESEKTLTAADGTYTLSGLEPGRYRVRFQPTGSLAPQWFDGADTQEDATELTVGPGETRAGIDARLRPARAISGTVTDPQGNPLANVQVQVYAEGSSHYTDRVTTDSQGTFVTQDLPKGAYRVYLRPLSPTAFAAQWYDRSATRAGATPVRVTDGQKAVIAAELEPGGSITGTVTGSGGTPVAGAHVSAQRSGEFRYATTDADGNYEIMGLGAGDYAVEFSVSGSDYVSEWYDDQDSQATADPVAVGLGDASVGVDAQLARSGSISGTVRSADGSALSAGHVELYRGSEEVARSDVARDGTFTFPGLRSGEYTMRASGTGEWLGQWWSNRPDRESADEVLVSAGENLTGQDFILVRGASVTGTVTGSGGTPLAGRVPVTDADGNPLGSARIQDGSYSVVGLPAGTHFLRFAPSDPGWLEQWWDNKRSLDQATPVTLSDGRALSGIDAALAQAAKVHGRVLNGKGNPVDACVSVYVGMTNEKAGSACTDSTGRYVVGGLEAGNYQVLFDPESGYARQWWSGQTRRTTATSIALTTAGEATADATLLKGGSLTGVVTDEAGDPLGGVQIRAYGSPDSYSDSAVTDGQGRYTLMGLDDEDYRLQAVPGSSRLDLISEWYDDASDYSSADVVAVPNGATVDANFTLEKGASISGTVVDDQGPVSGIGVDVFDLDGNKALTVWTDPDGNYTSTALKAGQYKVRFMPGYYGGDGLVEQWWNRKSTEAKANLIVLGAKEQRAGINAHLRPVGAASAPEPPTDVVAVAGDGEVTVTWQAPSENGGLPITRYVVEGAPSGECSTLGDLSCTVQGLENGESFAFTVRAVNSAGSSEVSELSSVVVPFGKPQRPTGITATAGVDSATVSWTPGDDNGRPVLDYTVTATPGGSTCTTSGSSCVVTGLTGGTGYTFTVRARNVAGQSDASDPSSLVTPPVTIVPTPTTPPRPTVLLAPSRLNAKVKKGRAAVSWVAVRNATSYQVRMSPAKGKKKGAWKRTTKRTFTSRKLKKGSYFVEVRAVGDGGSGATSSKRVKVK